MKKFEGTSTSEFEGTVPQIRNWMEFEGTSTSNNLRVPGRPESSKFRIYDTGYCAVKIN